MGKINLLTIGDVSRVFRYMNQKDENEVARRFNLKSNILENYINNNSYGRILSWIRFGEGNSLFLLVHRAW